MRTITIRKLPAVLLALALVSVLLPVGVSAAGTLALEAGKVMAPAVPGTVIRVPIKATANSGYGSGILTVGWDKNVLELKDVEYSARAPKGYSADIQNTGKYIIDFGDDLATTNYTGTGTFFILVFAVRAGAAKGDYPISLSDFDINDKDIDPVTVTGKAGTVTLTDAAPVTLTGITITKVPARTAYLLGETFDKAGMEVTAAYSDNSTAKVTGYTVSPAGALKTSDTSVTVSYTENGVTRTVKQMITVKNQIWTFDKTAKSITITSAVSESCPVIVASYDDQGRFLGSTFVTKAGKMSSVVKSGAGRVAIFWIDTTASFIPKCAAEKIDL